MTDSQLFRVVHLLNSTFPSAILGIRFRSGEVAIYLHRDLLRPVLLFLRLHGHCRFRSLVDLWASDYPDRSQRFEVSYLLLSYLLNIRLSLRVLAHSATQIPSAADIFPSAGWLEREVWDMFGIFFAGHPDLRRILTDYGFDGFPLRKDFPLGGFFEVRYDDLAKKVLLEPVQFSQDYRYFDFATPWERSPAQTFRPPSQQQIT